MSDDICHCGRGETVEGESWVECSSPTHRSPRWEHLSCTRLAAEDQEVVIEDGWEYFCAECFRQMKVLDRWLGHRLGPRGRAFVREGGCNEMQVARGKSADEKAGYFEAGAGKEEKECIGCPVHCNGTESEEGEEKGSEGEGEGESEIASVEEDGEAEGEEEENGGGEGSEGGEKQQQQQEGCGAFQDEGHIGEREAEEDEEWLAWEDDDLDEDRRKEEIGNGEENAVIGSGNEGQGDVNPATFPIAAVKHVMTGDSYFPFVSAAKINDVDTHSRVYAPIERVPQSSNNWQPAPSYAQVQQPVRFAALVPNRAVHQPRGTRAIQPTVLPTPSSYDLETIAAYDTSHLAPASYQGFSMQPMNPGPLLQLGQFFNPQQYNAAPYQLPGQSQIDSWVPDSRTL